MTIYARLLTLALFIGMSVSAFAQLETTETEPTSSQDRFRYLKHSVGFGIVGGGELRSNYRGPFWPMPGLGYKYHTENGAFRVMVGGIYNSSVSGGWGWGSNYSEGGFNGRIGYQYHVMVGRFMPIIGVDLAGGYSEYTSSWETGKEEYTTMVFGISPNLGFEFWITPKLSVLMDTRFDISYIDNETNFENNDPWGGPQNSFTRSQGMGTHISPISSFMAIFHF